jgi:hypothetical protein
MLESTTVTVGLDVHARSIRLATLRADELLQERTLPYDEEAVERLLRRWPGVHCCYEAGPTGFGLYRHLVEPGIDCAVVAPGLLPAAALRRRWLGEQRFEFAADQLTFDTYVHAGRSRRRSHRDARAVNPGDGRAGAVVRAGRQAALPVRHPTR